MNSKNEIIIYDNYAEIVLYDRKGAEKGRAIIDIEDVEKVKGYRFCMDKRGYIRRTKDKLLLHRFILDYEGNLEVDHINGNKLDNKKSNLRLVTHQQNMLNRGVSSNNKSGKTGVYFYKPTNKWVAQISVNKKTTHLGCFNTLEEAVKAREEAEIKYFGEYRRE